MTTYVFEATDAKGLDIKDEIEAQTEDEAQSLIRQQGYFVTNISVKKTTKSAADRASSDRRKRGIAIGGVSSRVLTGFTRQLSILQDAGLPILRSLRILEGQCKPGKLKYSLMDTCDGIEGGATLSEALGDSPKVFNRLYVNMIKAGEAGGALEVILRRLAEFMERSESLKRKVKGALIYPVVVVLVAVSILTFIMISIVPAFREIFADFDTELPAMTEVLVTVSNGFVEFWYLIPGFPIAIWLFVKMLRKFEGGRMGFDMYILKIPVFGPLLEKNSLARTTRTLGTLVSSGVPILEGLNITRETSGNAVFERLYGKISEAIRDGDTIANPMRMHSKPGFHPVALTLWVLTGIFPFTPVFMIDANLLFTIAPVVLAVGALAALFYYMRMNTRVVDDIVVNMVDVGEETGELDTMLYKVADNYDEEVRVMTEGLVAVLEPLLIVFLGGVVGFIVIALFMPLISLITKLSG